MIHFIRLFRIVNLGIILLTIGGISWYFDTLFLVDFTFHWEFLFLMLGIILITAGGNIINDFYDVKIDEINRPDKLVISKFISKKKAIVLYFIINLVSLLIGFYVSFASGNYIYLGIFIGTVFLLWLYSFQLKKRGFIGNITVAFLTALVPLLVGMYYHSSLGSINQINSYYPFRTFSISQIIFYFSIGFALFSFLLNLAREIIKDIEDYEGDKLEKVKTLPLVLGKKVAVYFVLIVLLSFLLFLAYSVSAFLDEEIKQWEYLPLIFSAFSCMYCVFILVKPIQEINIVRVKNAIKIAMVLGLLSPIYWSILMHI